MANADATRAAGLLQRARVEAQETGSPTVEAEHMLLAIAAQKGTLAQRLLAAEGLDHAGILAGLEREFEESLAGAGVSLSAFDLPPARRRNQTPRWGTSFKVAMQRTRKGAGEPGGRLDATQLLLGILRARVGRVARMLSLSGIDRAALVARAEGQLAGRNGP